jgi:hypothetical protein
MKKHYRGTDGDFIRLRGGSGNPELTDRWRAVSS